jgi:hypothetical protein
MVRKTIPPPHNFLIDNLVLCVFQALYMHACMHVGEISIIISYYDL